jgi:hypothetical protein
MIRTDEAPRPRHSWRPSVAELFLYFVAVMVAVPGYPSLYKFGCLAIIALIIRAVRRHQTKRELGDQLP